MAILIQEGPLWEPGYPWTVRVETEALTFPVGATFRAMARLKPTALTAIGDATTANGQIVRISDYAIDLTFTNIETALALFPGKVWIDMARTDVNPDIHLGWFLEMDVTQPITR
jgi:hypothetical protein